MSSLTPMLEPENSASPAPVDAGFTPEQKQYLVDMLAQLNLSQTFGGGQGQSQGGADESFWGTPIDDLCKEEKKKSETHVLDIWDQIVEHNDTNQIADGINNYMFRHHGLFNVAPNMEGYMCRMRLPACKLRGDQLFSLGQIANEIAGGYTHVTTRGNLQFREISPNKILDLFAAFYDIGLSSKGSGADSARNLTASPTAGFDPLELMDLHGYALQLSHRVLNTRDLHGIPRKFNISFDNAGSISVVSDTNDVAFVATEVLANDQSVEPGLYCRVLLGGITGHEDFARDSGVVCKPEDTPEVAEAILRVFLEHGDRTNRKKARFKYVIDKHGLEWVVDCIQQKLDSFGRDVKLIPLSCKFDAPRAPINRRGHIGVHPQSQAGYNYIGVALRIGKMTGEQMQGLGQIAQKYGANDVRLTVWQNLIIPHVADDDVEAVVEAIKKLGLEISASAFSAGAVACTGRWGCKLANAYTKQDAETIVDQLQKSFGELDTPLNIHLTGCPNSCAQHYIGDIGLVGTPAEDGSEGYDVYVGGGCDQDQGLARYLCGPISSKDVGNLSEQIIGNYLKSREENESFLAFSKRHDDSQLKSMLLAPNE
ncbi:MAG: NirA family protein [Pseudomonadota bacterium]